MKEGWGDRFGYQRNALWAGAEGVGEWFWLILQSADRQFSKAVSQSALGLERDEASLLPKSHIVLPMAMEE
jgi:hypothetical protein